MRILYAIQGTGNGHLSRARDVVPCLQQHGEVHLLISGTQTDVHLPWPIQYQLYGISFIFGKNGGIDLFATLKKLRPFRFIRDIYRLPVEAYDLVITDFEPVSAWACRLKGKKCYGMSHQAAFLSPLTPLPDYYRDRFATFLFRYYAPISDYFGFHFEKYDQQITTPVIREEVRQLRLSNDGHIVVYLPAYADEVLLRHFQQLPEIRWELFSKHAKTAYRRGHVHLTPIDNTAYLQSLANCTGLVTGGGFEAPAEALYLGKKIMVIPMKGQFEQHANAAAAARLGALVVREINEGFATQLRSWLLMPAPLAQNFPNNIKTVVDTAIAKWHGPKIA